MVSDPVVNEIGIYITTYNLNWGFHIFYKKAKVMTHAVQQGYSYRKLAHVHGFLAIGRVIENP